MKDPAVTVTLRLPPELLEKIETVLERFNHSALVPTNRTQVIAQAIRFGLEQIEDKINDKNNG